MENSHTILELLIVIVMLGILYSMYVGAISKAKRSSDIAVCHHYQHEFKTMLELDDFHKTIEAVSYTHLTLPTKA